MACARRPASWRVAGMRPRTATITDVLLACIPVIGLAASCAYLIWSFNRGFDITDDGYYLLSARSPEEIFAPANGFFYFCTAQLYQASGGSIFNFRVLGLLCLVFSSFFFATQYVRTLGSLHLDRSGNVFSIAWIALMLLAAVSFYAQHPPSPGYNLLNLCGMLVASAALLRAMTRPDATISSACAWLALAGLGVGFCLWAKWPTGACMIITSGICICCWPVRRYRHRLVELCAFGVGLITWSVLMLATAQTPSDLIPLLMLGIDYVVVLGSNHSQHPLSLLMSQCAVFCADLFSHYKMLPLLIACVPSLASTHGAVGFYSERRFALWSGVGAVCVLLMCVVVGDAQGGSNDPDHGLLNVFAWFMYWALLSILVIRAVRTRGGRVLTLNLRQCLPVILLLAVLPFIFSVGTASKLATTGASANIFLVAATGVCIALAGNLLGSRRLVLVGIACMALLATSRIVTSGSAPYRLATGLHEQSFPVEIGGDGDIMLTDQATADAIMQLRACAAEHEMPQRQDVIALMGMPGLVYAMNGTAPGVPWNFGGYPGSRNAATLAMEQVEADRRRDSWLLISDDVGLDHQHITALVDRVFPDDYELLEQIHWPVGDKAMRLYRPKR